MFLGAFAVGLWALALWPADASAQQPPPTAIRVFINAPVPLSVDGVESTGTLASVSPGSQVCVTATLHYVSVADRWSFERWSHGPRTECVTLTQPGVYRAVYAHEVLFTTPSVIGTLRATRWVTHGSAVGVNAPPTVAEGERVRYRFSEWSGGETPFQSDNRIAVLGPTTVEAKWTKEYLVRVEGPEGITVPGTGWYADGASMYLQAQETVTAQARNERLKFKQWESAGLPPVAVPNAQETFAVLAVGGPYTIKAVYDRQVLVVATNPGGTLLREWKTVGDEVVLETPPIIEIVPEQVQLVFRRWEGQEGLISTRIAGTANLPVELRAVYDRQVYITVDAPYGASGGGWQREGAAVTVSVPGSAQSKLVFRRVFQGFPGQATSDEPSVQVVAREPITITALYRNEVNVPVLALLLLVPLAGAIVFIIGRWVVPVRVRGEPRAARRRGRPTPSGAGEGEQGS